MSFAISDEKFDELKEKTDCIHLNEDMILCQGHVFYRKSWQEAKDANEPKDS